MNKKPLFSVVTVVLNDRKSFVTTVLSVVEQKISSQKFGIEFVVIDGGSGDGTIDEAKCHQESIDIFISEPDKGLYDAMNKGLVRCGGEYVIFMNAGDTFAENDTLYKIGNEIVNGDFPDFVYGDAFEKTATGELLLKKARSSSQIWYGMFTHHQAMLYRMERIGSLLYRLEYPIGADYAFTAEFLSKTGKILRLPFAVCIFAQGGLSSRSRRKGMNEQWDIRRDILGMSFFSRIFVRSVHTGVHLVKSLFPMVYKILRFS